VSEFLSVVEPTEDMRPVVMVKVTMFNPNLHTPMAGYDIRTLHDWNHQTLFGRLKGASVRFRLTMHHDSGRSVWRGLAHRARSAEEFRWLWRLRNMTRERITSEVERAGLRIRGSIEFGQSYSDTLRRWHETFNARWDEIAAMGFDDRFRRMWNFYLTSCAGSFRCGNCDVTQITVTRPR
jgi:hypothetical protein